MKPQVLFFFFLLIYSCDTRIDKQPDVDSELFEILAESYTGISHTFGMLPHSGIEGGGVAVGDLDNDGLQDIFFVGDSLHGLYRNKGNLEFENLFDQSQINPFRGGTSAVIYDVNQDGMNDILLGRRNNSNNPLFPLLKNGAIALEPTPSNLLIYINQGDFKFNQDSSFFIEIHNPVSGISLLDFDKNNLIDIAVSNWDVDFQNNNGALINLEGTEISLNKSSISIFSQEKPGKFIENSKELGINHGGKISTSYSLISSDINHDNWVDILVTNDFDLPDYYYKNILGEYFELQKFSEPYSFYSMGIDAADLNNDCKIDLVTSDMRPSSYLRTKTAKFEKPYDWDILKNKYGNLVVNQQVKNTVKINQGDFIFSEVSEQIHADASEWSWAVLLADFDNNGWKDIFYANGYYYQSFLEHDTPLILDSVMKTDKLDGLFNLIIADTLSNDYFYNYFFRNEGNLNFTNTSKIWVEPIPFNTRGAAYADLDNDGDLDLIFNNAKQKSIILKNKSVEQRKGNYIRLYLESSEFPVLHSTVKIYFQGNVQFSEYNPCRGFYSSSEQFIHFGLNGINKLDSVCVFWPNGKKTTLIDVYVNQVLKINYLNSESKNLRNIPLNRKLIENSPCFGLDYLHHENNYLDFQQNLLLPQEYSKFGPYLATGDLTGNGLEDLVIGGAMGYPTTIFYQDKNESFRIDTNSFILDKEFEDADISIFDIDGDGKQDIFIASGGNEKPEGDEMYTPRYYLNKGNGRYESHKISLINQSTSVVRVTNWKNDPLVFLGGRLKPWNYPLKPPSYLIAFRKGQWVDISKEIAPDLNTLGMITDAIWTDFDNDGLEDLIVVGEYMAPVFFKNSGSSFFKISNSILGNKPLNGLYTSITSGDFNRDGFPDYVLGNTGLNTRYKASEEFPLEIFANDYDDNGSLDVITAYYEGANLYPIKDLNVLKSRINGFAKKYYKHSDFANVTIFDMFDLEKLNKGFHAVAHTTASIYLLSDGNGGFEIRQLPFWAQVSPISDMKIYDFNKDGFDDIILVGNYFPVEVERGKYTAQKGLILLGDGNGSFKEVLPGESGFWADGDTRSLEILNRETTSPIILVGRNSNSLLSFEIIKN